MRRRDTLPVIDPAELPAISDERLAHDHDRPTEVDHGVVLAAGTSSRFGERNKLLVSLEREPLVRHATRTLLASDVTDVTVVVGYESEKVRAAVADLDVDVLRNDRFEDGQSTSVAAGVAAAKKRNADTVVLALGDMPAVSVETVNLLLSVYRQEEENALAAAHEGRRGNPVLFDRQYFDDLITVDGDVGGRELLLEDGAAVETGDPGVLHDVDQPDDL